MHPTRGYKLFLYGGSIYVCCLSVSSCLASAALHVIVATNLLDTLADVNELGLQGSTTDEETINIRLLGCHREEGKQDIRAIRGRHCQSNTYTARHSSCRKHYRRR